MSGSENECHLPIPIDDSEKVVRAIKTPFYFHRKRKHELTFAALLARSGSSDVSVTRQLMGDNFCADMSRKTVKPENATSYCGMLVMNVKTIRDSGSTVYDHREDFCGHAHINHGVVMGVDDNETSDPKIMIAVKERCKKIIEESSYRADSYTDGPGWKNSPL